MMLEELQRRNYSQHTTRCYIRTVEDFARRFNRSPDRLGPRHIREFQAELFQKRKLSPGRVTRYLAALRFFYTKTLEVARDPRHLGAEIGFFTVVHTWNQKLELHRISIVSFPPVGCHSITPTGLNHAIGSFFPSKCSVAFSAASLLLLSSRPSVIANSSFMET
jgi:Phage integrase, N-terminal SAM-like domain